MFHTLKRVDCILYCHTLNVPIQCHFREKGVGLTPIRKISLLILVSPEKKCNIVFRNEGRGGGGGRGGGVKGGLEFHTVWKIHPNLII